MRMKNFGISSGFNPDDKTRPSTTGNGRVCVEVAKDRHQYRQLAKITRNASKMPVKRTGFKLKPASLAANCITLVPASNHSASLKSP
jgi:hypothetical protein